MNDNIFAKARLVSIEDILDRLGAKLSKGRGASLLYHCPYREDKNPSLYVNADKGTWRDMANPEELNGDGIRLVEITLHLRPYEAAKYIIGENTLTTIESRPKRERTAKESETINYTVQELTHPALLEYMNARGIADKLSKRLCKEIHIGKLFFIGFPSQSGGYELRNKFSKRTLGKKDISVLGTGDNAIIFEGFIDLLSHLQAFRYMPNYKYIVLNSVSNTNRVIEHFDVFGTPQTLELWLDNDKGGRDATEAFTEKLSCNIVDKSSVYAPYNDINEWFTATNNK